MRFGDVALGARPEERGGTFSLILFWNLNLTRFSKLPTPALYLCVFLFLSTLHTSTSMAPLISVGGVASCLVRVLHLSSHFTQCHHPHTHTSRALQPWVSLQTLVWEPASGSLDNALWTEQALQQFTRHPSIFRPVLVKKHASCLVHKWRKKKKKECSLVVVVVLLFTMHGLFIP